MTVGRRMLVMLSAIALIGSIAAVSVPGNTVVAKPSPGKHAASLSGATPSQPPARVPQSKRPNVVLVMTDDMRYDDLAFMPRVRRLVQRTGVTFENSFSPYPLCCPARASLLTGLAAHNHRVYWHHAPYGFGAFDDSFTLATAMKRAGYHTGFLGKYLNGYGNHRSKVTGRLSHRYVPRGWTDWRAAVGSPRWALWSGGPYNFFNTPYNVNGRVDATHRGEYQTHTLGRMAREMVSTFHRSRKPFFVFASFTAPHQAGPREPDDPARVRRSDGSWSRLPTTARPKSVRGRFDRVVRHAGGVPTNGGPVEADVSDKPSRFQVPALNAAERRALREVTRQRAEALYVVDREVGRLIGRLKRTREWSNTVLVFTSDNGFYLGEHRRRVGKVTSHEPALRVPLLLTGPGVPRNASRFDPATTMDLTATIADLGNARSEFGYPLEGESLWPVVTGGDRGWDRPVLTEALYGGNDGQPHTWEVPGGPAFEDPRGSIGIRTARYKLTLYATGERELYDLATDPNELEGLQDDPSYDEVEAALLDLWWRYKDCRGDACTAPMAGQMRTDPTRARQLTQGLVRERVARYGR